MKAQEKLARWKGQSHLPIILFHRVTDAIPEDGLTVSVPWFRGFGQMMRSGFQVVPLSRIFDYVARGEQAPARTVAITFDDCYRDNLWAARHLAELQLPATFFVPAQFVGTSHAFPWDRHLPPQLNLSWDDVAEMAHLGHEIGSHTMTHIDLGRASHEEAHWELAESKRVLEDRLERPIRYLAYPFGERDNFRPEYEALAYELGYEGIVSGYGGFAYPGMKERILPREPAPCFRSLINLELRLTGCLDWYYSLKSRPNPSAAYASEKVASRI